MSEIKWVETIGPNGREMIPVVEEDIQEQEAVVSEVKDEVVEETPAKKPRKKKTTKEAEENA